MTFKVFQSVESTSSISSHILGSGDEVRGDTKANCVRKLSKEQCEHAQKLRKEDWVQLGTKQTFHRLLRGG